jgi:hypothetical protein
VPKALLAALAAAAMLAGATPFSDASAIMLVAPSLPGAGTVPTRIAVICGMGGCAPIHVSRVHHPPRGFVKKAAPLVFPRPSSPPSAPANN